VVDHQRLPHPLRQVDSARWAAEAATWDERVFAAVALHPTRTSDFGDDVRAELTRLAGLPRVVAIGETGLDYYWDYAPRDAQQLVHLLRRVRQERREQRVRV
ncbi:TatD family hydrolase, partial [Saccharothrix sp. MB29]|nr:TatD family hydrolase [Saccharothrix sp. MB29]